MFLYLLVWIHAEDALPFRANETAQAVQMRVNDHAYFAPWSRLNCWPNSIEQMSAERHPRIGRNGAHKVQTRHPTKVADKGDRE